ncbi:hypothetical protein GF366_04385 [Candidatus Peregrinibacteria bacterium]|nr:hypothetical protein [Candidatus Peregrinibacteria bacterium]
MNKIDSSKIPAFQRKRSLAAKARKKPTKITRKRTNNKAIRKTRIDYPEKIDSIQKLPEVREMKTCGTCDGFFEAINVAVVKVTSPIRTGDRIIFEKENGLFEQTVESMQINRKNITLAKSGSDIGLKVTIKPTVGTLVYKVI